MPLCSLRKVIFLVALLLVEPSSTSFMAYKANNMSSHDTATISASELAEFHRNAVHAEQIGLVAEYQEECGIVLLDYSSYTSGAVFDAVLKPLVRSMATNTTLNSILRGNVYKVLRSNAENEHLSEMKELFGSYMKMVDHYEAQQLQFFPFGGVVAFGIGLGLGKLIYDGVLRLVRKFSDEQQEVPKRVGDLNEKVDTLADILVTETSGIRYGIVFGLARAQIVQVVGEALKELFNHGKVSHRLINHENGGLLSAVGELMGSNRFDASLLSLYSHVAGDVLRATVLSMNNHVMELKVCYPVTRSDEVGHLLEVVPLGEFGTNNETFWWHKLQRHYYAPKSVAVTKVGGLKVVVDVGRCPRIGKTLLCEFVDQPRGCQLDRFRREDCTTVTFDSKDEEFTLVRPLLKTVVIATRFRRALYMAAPSDSGFTSLPVVEPVFVVEVPPFAKLHIGTHIIRSRMSHGNFSVNIKITVPSTDAFGPILPPAEDENWELPRSYSSSDLIAIVLLALLLVLLTAYIVGVVKIVGFMRRQRDWAESFEAEQRTVRDGSFAVTILD